MKTLNKVNDASNISDVRVKSAGGGKFELLIERSDKSSSWALMDQGLPIALPPGIANLEMEIVKACVLDSDGLVNVDGTTEEKLRTEFRIKALASFFSRSLVSEMQEDQVLSAFRLFRIGSVQES